MIIICQSAGNAQEKYVPSSMLLARVAGKRLVNEQLLLKAVWTGCQEGARVQTYLLVAAADNKASLW
jgi:hypothetical protein